MKFNFKIIVSCFLVFAVLSSGIIFLVIGIKDTYKLNKITTNYLTTTGYFKDYEIYSSKSSRKDSTTYKLIYSYEVEGIGYTASTDYGVRIYTRKKQHKRSKI